MAQWTRKHAGKQRWRVVNYCVGATTLDEYRQYIEKDAALERRFRKCLLPSLLLKIPLLFCEA